MYKARDKLYASFRLSDAYLLTIEIVLILLFRFDSIFNISYKRKSKKQNLIIAYIILCYVLYLCGSVMTKFNIAL